MASERKPPGVFSVFLGAVLSITLGGLLGGIHLASQPVEVMKTAPKEAPPADKLYYVMGAAGSTAGKSWETKRDVLASGAAGAAGAGIGRGSVRRRAAAGVIRSVEGQLSGRCAACQPRGSAAGALPMAAGLGSDREWRLPVAGNRSETRNLCRRNHPLRHRFRQVI